MAVLALLAGFGAPEARASETRPIPGVRYLHQDPRFDGVAVTDGSGRVVERMAYTPWGEVQGGGIPGPISARFGFSGNGRAEDCLLDFHARWYDPCIGRFLSPDPLGQFASSGLFAGASPVDHADPEGMVSEEALGRIRSRMTLLHIDETELYKQRSLKNPNLHAVGTLNESIGRHKRRIERRLIRENARDITWTTTQLGLSNVAWREGPMTPQDLPNELLLKIAEYVTWGRGVDFGAFCLVCRRFRAVAEDKAIMELLPRHRYGSEPVNLALLVEPAIWLELLPEKLSVDQRAMFRLAVRKFVTIEHELRPDPGGDSLELTGKIRLAAGKRSIFFSLVTEKSEDETSIFFLKKRPLLKKYRNRSWGPQRFVSGQYERLSDKYWNTDLPTNLEMITHWWRLLLRVRNELGIDPHKWR